MITASGTLVAVLLLLFLLSAFFAGTEVSLFSLDKHQVEEEEGAKGAAIRQLLREPRALLVTILVGNELVNILISALSVRLVGAGRDPADALPWWVNILVVTPGLLIVGDILPKALGVRLGVRWARVAARPLLWFQRVATPLRLTVQGIASLFLRPFGAVQDPLPQALQEQQFRALVTLGEEHGALRENEARLIHRVFDLGDTPVSRVMTKRSEVESVSLSTSLAEIVETVRGSRFSRLPVHQGDEDQIRGVLLTKDLLQLQKLGEPLTPRALERTLKPILFVPPSKTCGALLREFQKGRHHMAVVLDEFGSMLGIVTMQDVLEELFEPIQEELDDRPTPGMDRIAEGTWRVQARLEVEEWNRRMKPPIPEGETYTTLAGYVMHLFGRLPAKGEEISDGAWTFHVAGVDGTRLQQFTIRAVRGPGAP